MILACDISTIKSGFAILSLDGKDIVLSETLLFDGKNIGLTLMRRAKLFENYVKDIRSKYSITRILIEEPFLMVAVGTGNTYSTALLQRFNGICSYITYSIFDIEPELVNVNAARSSLGIKFRKDMIKKEKKDFVIDFVKTKFCEQFIIEKTKFGNYKETVSDRADAIVLALYALKQS